jgi:hypothetical protein
MLFQKDEQLAEEMLKMEFFKKGFEQKLIEKDFEKKLELLQKEREKDIELLKKDKDKDIELLKKDKDMLKKDKDNDIELLKKDKDKDIELLKKDKDNELAIEKIISQKEIEIKNIQLEQKEKELLGAKGLLTARGIFEFYIHQCFDELQKLGLANEREKFKVSHTINKLNKPEIQAKMLPNGKCRKLLKAADDCNVEIHSVYATLSNDIHGSPWNGPGVRVNSENLPQKEACLLDFVASDLSLKMLPK